MKTKIPVPMVLLVWVIVGVIIAVNKDYGHHLSNASRVSTFVLAVLLWPILAANGSVGITFH